MNSFGVYYACFKNGKKEGKEFVAVSTSSCNNCMFYYFSTYCYGSVYINRTFSLRIEPERDGIACRRDYVAPPYSGQLFISRSLNTVDASFIALYLYGNAKSIDTDCNLL